MATARRSIIPRVLALLAAGAIINIAVAWGCAVLPPTKTWNADTSEAWAPIVRARMHDGTNDTWSLHWENRLGVCVTAIEVHWTETGHAETHGVIQQCFAGWPAYALQGEVSFDYRMPWAGPCNSRYGIRPKNAIAIVPDSAPFSYATAGIVPLAPLWPGFAINTIFYAAISWGAWLLFAAPLALRRRLRLRRG